MCALMQRPEDVRGPDTCLLLNLQVGRQPTNRSDPLVSARLSTHSVTGTAT